MLADLWQLGRTHAPRHLAYILLKYDDLFMELMMQEDDFSNVLAQSATLKEKMRTMETSFSQSQFQSKVQGIQVSIDGEHKVQSILLDPEIQNAPTSAIIEPLLACLNQAYQKAELARKEAFLEIVKSIGKAQD